MKIILASASPRRQELLKNIFPDFIIMKSGSEEQASFQNPTQYVMDLAYEKALDVAGQLASSLASTSDSDVFKSSEAINGISCDSLLIIGADTIVYHNGCVLGKPSTQEEAYSMLRTLSGSTHEVYTGVTLHIIESDNEQTHSFSCCTKVCVNPLSDEEIYAYIATGDCYDKAGSYGIQGPFSKHISSISGDYFNVVGLPVSKLYEEIKKLPLCRYLFPENYVS